MNLSFKQYRAIDLFILAIVLAFSEAVFCLGSMKWFWAVDYIISPTVAIVCIVMMRWNGFAVIHAVLAGVVFALASGATPEQFAVYAAGNCGILIGLLMLKFVGKKRVADGFFLTAAYVILSYLGCEVGRWLIGLMVGGSADDLLRFISADMLSLAFGILVVMIARKMDGLFEDQKAYLIRMDEERRKEQELHDREDL